MSKRETAIALARAAGYHTDRRSFTRLIVESRVARSAMHAAWNEGQRAKQAGTPCACYACRQPYAMPIALSGSGNVRHFSPRYQ